MFKKVPLALIILNSFFLTILFSCKKNTNGFQENLLDSTIIKSVKNYLDLRQIQYVDSGKLNVEIIKQDAIYSGITIEQLNSTERLIIVPLKDTFKTRNNTITKSFKNLVLIETENHKFRKGDIVEIIPVNQNIKQIPANTISKAYKNQKIILDCKISILTLHDRNICDLIYQNGKLKNYNVTKPKKNGRSLDPYKPSSITVDCTDWYWMYYIDGILVAEEYAYTTCSGCDEQQSFIATGINGTSRVDCGGGGGSGSNNGYYETIVTVDSVDTSELTQPCIIAAFNALTSTTLKNCIAKLYQETFVGMGNVYNLRIGEVISITSPGSNNQLPGSSSPDPNDPTTWVININSGFDHELTQELWGSIILHELVHGFIQKNSLDFTPTSSFNTSHQQMLYSWIDDMKQELIDAFGISNDDAMALTLEGFDDILKDDVSGQFRDDMKQWMHNLYNVDLAAMSQIANDYYSKAKGTGCQ